MQVRVVRVFTNEQGRYGNPLGVVVDPQSVPATADRIALAAELGFTESAFLDDVDAGKVSFYSGSRGEVPFGGHAAIGAAWVLGQLTGTVPAALSTPLAGEVPTWADDDVTWVRSSLATTPPWWHERLESADAVDALDGPLSPSQDLTQLWGWLDEPAGVVRVRTFAGRAGVAEDEACGSGAMRLAAALGRPLTLHHGRGSVLYVKPGPPGHAAVGGRVSEEQTRTVG